MVLVSYHSQERPINPNMTYTEFTCRHPTIQNRQMQTDLWTPFRRS